VGASDADILTAAIQILPKRVAAGTATFLVKVKVHRGESANEGADILADKAISDPKVGKKCCQPTNRAVFTWRKPCREAGKVTYQDRHSTSNNSVKHCRVEIIAFHFVIFHRDCFFNFSCLRQQFSAAYLLKLFLLPQRVYTTLFIRRYNPELTRWCLCSLHAGIQMSPDEVEGSRDNCRHSIAESTVDVPIRLFQQIFSLAPCCSRALLHNLQLTSDRCLIFATHLPSFLAFCVSRRSAGRSNTSRRLIYVAFITS